MSKLFGDCLFTRKLLLVQKTGGGKSHVLRVLGTFLRGIHVIVYPLLVLTADQVLRFLEGTDTFGSIEAHNLDEQGTVLSKWRKKFIDHLSNISKSTTSAIFVFTSP